MKRKLYGTHLAERYVKEINAIAAELFAHRKNHDRFDYPDYWGIDRRIACRLTSDFVDRVQDLEDAIRKCRSRDQVAHLLFKASIVLPT